MLKECREGATDGILAQLFALKGRCKHEDEEVVKIKQRWSVDASYPTNIDLDLGRQGALLVSTGRVSGLGATLGATL